MKQSLLSKSLAIAVLLSPLCSMGTFAEEMPAGNSLYVTALNQSLPLPEEWKSETFPGPEVSITLMGNPNKRITLSIVSAPINTRIKQAYHQNKEEYLIQHLRKTTQSILTDMKKEPKTITEPRLTGKGHASTLTAEIDTPHGPASCLFFFFIKNNQQILVNAIFQSDSKEQVHTVIKAIKLL